MCNADAVADSPGPLTPGVLHLVAYHLTSLVRRRVHLRPGLSREDLRQSLLEAVCMAWVHFDPEKGAAWRTFAEQRVAGVAFDLCHPQRRVRHAARRTVWWQSYQRLHARQSVPAVQVRLEAQDRLQWVLQGVSARHRAVLLAVLSGQTQRTIAQRFGTSEATICQWLKSACQQTTAAWQAEWTRAHGRAKEDTCPVTI